jgi:hypothetical protein
MIAMLWSDFLTSKRFMTPVLLWLVCRTASAFTALMVVCCSIAEDLMKGAAGPGTARAPSALWGDGQRGFPGQP